MTQPPHAPNPATALRLHFESHGRRAGEAER